MGTAALPVDPARYGAYCLAMALMAITPGPANVFFIRTGLSGIKNRILWGLIGINSATLVWYIGASLGLAALIALLPLMFQIIAFAGGAFVVWLGYKTLAPALKSTQAAETFAAGVQKSPWATLCDGFMVQILNPKAVLFFTVVLPPFLDIHRPSGPQMTLFGATTLFMDVCAMSAYGFGALHLSRFLSVPQNRQKFEVMIGAILMSIGVLIIIHSITDSLKSGI